MVWTLLRPNLHFRTFLSDRWALISSGRASAVTSCFVYLLRLLTRPQQQDQKLPPTPAATDPPRHPTPSINFPPSRGRREIIADDNQSRGEGRGTQASNQRGIGSGTRRRRRRGMDFELRKAREKLEREQRERVQRAKDKADRERRAKAEAAPPRRARGVPPRAPPRRRPRAGRGNNTTTKAHNNHVPNLLGNLGLGSLLLPPSVIHFAVVCIGFYPV